MSLATIAFTRLATKIITPLSWAASSSSATSSTIGSAFLQRSGVLVGSQYQLSSIRSVFSEVIRQVPSDDPQKQGMLTFEDPDLADARIVRNIRGESPLRRRKKFLRHEKGWMRRKRMKMERRHLRLHEQVEELKAYIKFKQDYRP
mmetsp:Transcript_23556/g.46861  ORF Transcript_23556/g.46861 Transcript_23556/m.46861 type:complete len:146 (+) Transcript_23556:36-473(+)|eukprot:CAMPEP_0113392028 /NCGR_PEP_ID=MMETSP0013_2-20120614/11052_1 /TAXON_ID=2843 ORGANISM="Skeletonema costatum, Strain 1716" /NCGR_SAMPLE_ID=MMETSP0013_2 /ASSEMBLY_ACC=CAM_ASM_000158 /LENGTH=145 /DNA_ID=CAMNT_0000275365 /DNA_START=6 /DNA_END=443 /DNA_ORIENTATION=- /assembly_acc=CAM_ASM_000158